MNWLQLALGLLQLAPDVLELVVKIEQLIGAGNGAAKKQIALAAAAPGETPTHVQAGVSNLIDTTVSVLNSTGVFKKTA
jgi:hypothetical protein